MNGSRKFYIAIVSLVCYTIIQTTNIVTGEALGMESLYLGFGIASLLGTIMFGYRAEYQFGAGGAANGNTR